MHGEEGACVVKGGVHGEGGMCGEGGACVVCMAGHCAGGTHPTGMHSCNGCSSCQNKIYCVSSQKLLKLEFALIMKFAARTILFCLILQMVLQKLDYSISRLSLLLAHLLGHALNLHDCSHLLC